MQKLFDNLAKPDIITNIKNTIQSENIMTLHDLFQATKELPEQATFAQRVTLARAYTDMLNAGEFDDFCENQDNSYTIKKINEITCKSAQGNNVLIEIMYWLSGCYTECVGFATSELEKAIYKELDLDLDDYYSDDV